jgi:hypothetical protein
MRQAVSLRGAAPGLAFRGLAWHPVLPRAPRGRAVAAAAAWRPSSAPAPGPRPARTAAGRSRGRAPLVVRAVFEKFNERSIKSVMIAQKTAKELGASEVRRRMEKLARRARARSGRRAHPPLSPEDCVGPRRPRRRRPRAPRRPAALARRGARALAPRPRPRPRRCAPPPRAAAASNAPALQVGARPGPRRPRRPPTPAPAPPPSPAPAQVTTEHVLLGLVSEDAAASKHGYMGSGLTPEAALAAVEALGGRRRPIPGDDNIPFAREVRKVFEAATAVSGFWLLSGTALGARRRRAAQDPWRGGFRQGRAAARVGGATPGEGLRPPRAPDTTRRAPAGVQALGCDLHRPGAHPAGDAGTDRLPRPPRARQVGGFGGGGWRRGGGGGGRGGARRRTRGRGRASQRKGRRAAAPTLCRAPGTPLPPAPPSRSLGADLDALRAEAARRVKGDGDADAAKKRRDKDAPRALDEFCRDLCAEVRAGRIDPVGGRGGGGVVCGVGGRQAGVCRRRIGRAPLGRLSAPEGRAWSPACAHPAAPRPRPLPSSRLLGHRPRARGGARHPDPGAPHQEQPHPAGRAGCAGALAGHWAGPAVAPAAGRPQGRRRTLTTWLAAGPAGKAHSSRGAGQPTSRASRPRACPLTLPAPRPPRRWQDRHRRGPRRRHRHQRVARRLPAARVPPLKAHPAARREPGGGGLGDSWGPGGGGSVVGAAAADAHSR